MELTCGERETDKTQYISCKCSEDVESRLGVIEARAQLS